MTVPELAINILFMASIFKMCLWVLLALGAPRQEPKAQQPVNLSLERGIALAQQNRLEEAEREFDSVPPTDPSYWIAQYYSAVAKAQLKKTVPAQAILKRLLAKDPNYKEAHFLMGMMCEESRDLAGAATHFRKVTALAPQELRGWIALGRALGAQGKADEAGKALAEAEKLSPDDPEVALLVGMNRYALGHYPEAVKILLPLWQANSNDKDLATMLATSYAASNEAAALDGFLGTIPDSLLPEVQQAVGLMYLSKGDEKQGFGFLMAGAQARPDDFQLQRVLADAMLKSGLNQDAQRVYQQCLAIKPKDGETVFLLGRALYEDRKIAEALIQYKAAVQLIPKSAEAWFHLGICHRALQEIPEAKAAFQRSLALEGRNAETLYNLGMVALREEQKPAAQSYFEKAIQRSPGHFASHYELGRILMSQGKTQEALKEMDTVIKLNPRHTQGHYQRGMLLARLGQSAAAEKELQTFRRLEKEDREQRKTIESKILAPVKP